MINTLQKKYLFTLYLYEKKITTEMLLMEDALLTDEITKELYADLHDSFKSITMKMMSWSLR